MQSSRKTVVLFSAITILIGFFLVFGGHPIKAAQKIFYGLTTQSGLQAYWNFDECDTCTVVADRSGNRNSGTMNRSSSPTNLHTPSGKIGGGFLLNGTSDSMLVTDSTSLNPSQMTLSVWVRPNAGTLDALREIYRKQLDSSTIHLFSFQNSGNCSGGGGSAGCISFGLNISGSYAELDVNLNDGDWQGVWHQLIFTYDGTTKRIYMDGVEIGSAAVSGSITSTAPASAYIGSNADTGEYFSGSIDELRMYNRSLSVAEIKHLYEQGLGAKNIIKQRNDSELRGYWNFDECDECKTAKDLSGHGNNLTALNQAVHIKNGIVGSASDYDGTSDAFEHISPSSSLYAYSNVTLSAWVNYDTLGAGLYENAFIGLGMSNCNYPYYWNLQDTKIMHFFWEHGSGTNNDVDAIAAVTVNAGEWHHYAVTRDVAANQIRFFFDGAEVGTAVSYTNDPTEDTGCIFQIGADPPSALTGIDGKIDEVRIYGRELSDKEIQDLYVNVQPKKATVNKTLADYRDDLILHLTFDGPNTNWANSSAEFRDISPYGYTGDATDMDKSNSVIGVLGQALYFDSSNDYITMTDMLSYNSAPVSFVFWAKPETTDVGGIFDTAPNVGNVLRNYSTNQIEWWSGDPIINLTLTPDEWVHLAFVFYFDTNRRIEYYKNGRLEALASGGTGNTVSWTANSFTLGNVNGSLVPYEGALDDFRVYKSRLTAGHIKELYNSVRPE